MNPSELFELANRCLTLATVCFDPRVKAEITEIAVELIRKANGSAGNGATAGMVRSKARPPYLNI